jgi:sugar phosphate isomerase/epimerase
MTVRIGLSSGAFYPRTPTELVPARASWLGVIDVELMLQTPGEYRPGFLREVKSSANSAEVAIRSLHLFQTLHPFLSGYQRRTEEAFDLFRSAVEGAHICGSGVLVWHGATRADASDPGAWDTFVEITARLAEICAAAGITLGIENVSWCVITSVRDVLALNAALGTIPHAESVGFVFDSFQALESGTNPFMLLAAMEGRLVNVHISDGVRDDPATRHRLPGDGEIPWSALIKAIAATGYKGPLMLEAPVHVQADIDRVRAVLDPAMASAPGDDSCAEQLPDGVRAGIALFNTGEYYEAHEVIEHEWIAERRPIRLLYQGILQIGVGLHHARGGNHRGAELLLSDGIAKISQFLPECQGVRTDRLALAAQQCLNQIVELGPNRVDQFDWSLAPQIATNQA